MCHFSDVFGIIISFFHCVHYVHITLKLYLVIVRSFAIHHENVDNSFYKYLVLSTLYCVVTSQLITEKRHNVTEKIINFVCV